MTKAEARDAITVLLWATSTPAWYGPVADVVAEQAAKRLEGRARKALGPGAAALPRRESAR
jgi:hypothetical protein